jgi:hypothetical protein
MDDDASQVWMNGGSMPAFLGVILYGLSLVTTVWTMYASHSKIMYLNHLLVVWLFSKNILHLFTGCQTP